MKSVAYLTNSFPEPVESYVWEEIAELRSRGCNVIACSFRRPRQVSQSLAGLLNKTFLCISSALPRGRERELV